jgi:hypothetical protein
LLALSLGSALGFAAPLVLPRSPRLTGETLMQTRLDAGHKSVVSIERRFQMVTNQETKASVEIGKPKEPPFNLDREIKWLQPEMLKTGEVARKELEEETKWQMEVLDKLYAPLRDAVGKRPKGEGEITRSYLDEFDCEAIQSASEEGAQETFCNDLRSRVSPRIGSCVSALAPYPSGYNDPHSGGIGSMHSHLNQSWGYFGGETFLAVGGSQWLGTGVGEWVNSGANSGTASARADISVYGRCAEYSALFGYFRNIVRVHVRTWDSSGQQYDASQTIHDNWEVIGLNIRHFRGATFSPTVFFPVEPYRSYLVWAWAEQFTVCGGLGDGGTHLTIWANRLEICR